MAIYFEWDEDKAVKNLRDHGVRFEGATLAFEDPLRFTEEDSVVEGEQSWRTIGMADATAILLIVHLEEVYDDTLFVRIISARKATSLERREYEQNRANEF